MIVVKVKTENGSHAILVPAIIDTDGHVTVTNVAAAGAAALIRAEAYPESIKATPLPTGHRHRKRKQ